jgi:uncharacterized protein (TIGR01777 family)
MRVVIGGASGFLARSWREHLAHQGHEVIRLVRGEAVSPNESSWDPHRGEVDDDVIAGADVVANLGGASIAHWPWSETYKQTMYDSRVNTTRTLAEAVARVSGTKPVLLAQSGIDGYGDRGDEVLTEKSDTPGGTVLGEIALAWEAAARPAEQAGARVCTMRTGVVLHRQGDALKAMLPVFRLGLGGPLGDGSQYFSTISLHDWVRAVTFLAEDDSCAGVYNLTGPNQTTNEEFTRELGRALHRPTLVRAPAPVMKKALGELSQPLFASLRVEPERLLAAGFTFEQPTLEDRVAAALQR